MAFRRKDRLPDWLWIFLIAPLGLIVMLLWRQRNQRFTLARLRERLGRMEMPPGRKRYIEPDSIPLETQRVVEPVREPGGFTEQGVDEEDVVQAAGSFQDQASQLSVEPVTRSDSLDEVPAAEGEADDLLIIEGIGKSIAGLLRSHGIVTFRQLADTPLQKLREILVEARLQHLADPETWPEQARLAAQGKMDELMTLQAALKGGRRNR